MRWMVTMKLSPVKMELKACDKDGGSGRDDVGVEVVRGERRGEGPAGIDTAEHKGREGEGSADEVEVPAEEVDLGEGEIFRAKHDGDKEVAECCGDGRHQEEKDHDDAVHGEELVIGVGGDEIGLGSEEFEADEAGEGSSDKKEEGDGDEI